MTSLLRAWLKKQDVVWEYETKLEDAFANGYLIGVLLRNLELGGLSKKSNKTAVDADADAVHADVGVDDGDGGGGALSLEELGFVDDHSTSIKAVTNNYKLIAHYLYECGMQTKPKLLHEIADKHEGSIHRFIYDLKCFMDRKHKSSSNVGLSVNTNTNTRGSVKSGGAGLKSNLLTSPKLGSPRTRKILFEDMQKRDIESKIRNLMTKQSNERVHNERWQKFTDHRTMLEKNAEYESKLEDEMNQERIAQRHDSLITVFKTRQNTRVLKETFSKTHWIANQKQKKHRENNKAFYVAQEEQLQIEKESNRKKEIAVNVLSSLDEFELQLKKQKQIKKQKERQMQAETENENDELAANKGGNGNGNGNGNENEQIGSSDEDTFEPMEPETAIDESALDHLNRLRKSLPDETVSKKKTDAYFDNIRVKVGKQKQTWNIQRRRRKKLINDELMRHELKQTADRHELLQQIDTNQSAQNSVNRKFDTKIEKIELQSKIFEQNSLLMKEKELQQAQKDLTLNLTRDRLHFEHRKVVHKTKMVIETRKLHALQFKQSQFMHNENIQYCNQMVHEIIDVSFKTALYRQLLYGDKKNMDVDNNIQSAKHENNVCIPTPLWIQWRNELFFNLNHRQKHIHNDNKNHKNKNKNKNKKKTKNKNKNKNKTNESENENENENADDNYNSMITNIDEQKMHERLPLSEINLMLKNEKLCHTHIAHIEHALMYSMDIRDNINLQFINETEMHDYFNNHGIWGGATEHKTDEHNVNNNVNNHDQQNSEQYLSALLNEIQSVADGKKPEHKRIIPEVPITMIFIGKPFVGKTSHAQKICDKYALDIIQPQTCIENAIKAFETRQSATEEEESDTPDELTATEKLGEQLKSVLESGKEIDEELYVNLIFDTINNFSNSNSTNTDTAESTAVDVNVDVHGADAEEQKEPNHDSNDSNDSNANNGWILDGFPLTLAQAKLLETRLTGYIDDADQSNSKKKGKPAKKSKSKSKSVQEDADHNSGTTPASIKSGFDFVFYFDVQQNTTTGDDPSTAVAEADAGPAPEQEQEQELDIHTELIDRARGRLVDENSGRVYHITHNPPPHNLTIKETLKPAFDEEYMSKLTEHFQAFDERKPALSEWFQRFATWNEINCGQNFEQLNDDLCTIIKEKIETKLENEKQQKLIAEQKRIEEENALLNGTADAPAEATTTTGNPSTNDEDENDANINQNNTEAGAAEEQANNDQTEDTEPESPAMPWDTLSEDREMCQRLQEFYSNVEETFTDELLSNFNFLRHERRRVLAYLASIREYFYNFLRSPDAKQSLIDAFQDYYNNSIHPDLRRDEDTKNELHQKCQELNCDLFDCSLRKKNESIKELVHIQNALWFKNICLNVLRIMIHFIECEYNRYLATIKVINDYFHLKINVPLSSSSHESNDEQSNNELATAARPQQHTSILSILEKEDDISLFDIEFDTNIIQSETETGNDNEPEEQSESDGGASLVELRNKAFVERVITQLKLVIDKALEQQSNHINIDRIFESQAQLISDQNKNIMNESESETDAATEREAMKRMISDYQRIQRALIEHETLQFRHRLQRLSQILHSNITDIRLKLHRLIARLDAWIKLRVNGEDKAIKACVKYIQRFIENEHALHYRLVLKGENFLVDESVVLLPMPAPIQRSSIKNDDHRHNGNNNKTTTKSNNSNDDDDDDGGCVLSGTQIQRLSQILQQQSPLGIIEYSKMVELFERLIGNTYASNEEMVPLYWQRNVKAPQLYLLFSSVLLPCLKYQNSFLNWKLLIVSLMMQTLSVMTESVAIPSSQTLYLLKQALLAKDAQRSGYITKSDFNSIQLWFESATIANENANRKQIAYPANNILKHILFDLFCEKVQNPNGNGADELLLNYNQMLYHFCFNDESHFGYEKIILLSRNLNVMTDELYSAGIRGRDLISNIVLRNMQLLHKNTNGEHAQQLFIDAHTNGICNILLAEMKDNQDFLQYFNLMPFANQL